MVFYNRPELTEAVNSDAKANQELSEAVVLSISSKVVVVPLCNPL